MLADPAGTRGVSYGLAEFIAAEEMGRMRGYWWAPDGASLLVARVDENPVQRWYIADPANPERPPAAVAYPAAGTPNADVSLLLAGLDGSRVEVDTGGAAFPYLVTVAWEAGGDPLIVVQSRDQRVMRLLAADPGDRSHDRAARGLRPAVGGHRAGGARPDQRRPDRLDRRLRRDPAAAGRHAG